jgi:hypothetical protein
MSLSFINGRDGTGAFTIKVGAATAQVFTGVLDMFRVTEVNEMTNTDNFSIEGEATQEPGRSQLVGELSGYGFKGAGAAPGPQPLIPAPQGAGTPGNSADVQIVATFSTSCTITMNANFPRSTMTRLVNRAMRIAAQFISRGTYTVAWA